LTDGAPFDDPHGRSETFYGGMEGWHLDSDICDGYGYIRDGGQNNAEEDVIRYGVENTDRSYVLFQWKKDDFLAFSGATNVRFDGSPESRLFAKMDFWGGGPHADDPLVPRFVVENAGVFYLSESSWPLAPDDPALSFELAGADLLNESWALYDPVDDLRANGAAAADELLFNIATDTFDDVQGVGLYFERMAGFFTSDSYDVFEFEAGAVPEPATLTLVIPGLLALVFFGWLGRRALRRGTDQ